jgi:hypothetical protein
MNTKIYVSQIFGNGCFSVNSNEHYRPFTHFGEVPIKKYNLGRMPVSTYYILAEGSGKY